MSFAVCMRARILRSVPKVAPVSRLCWGGYTRGGPLSPRPIPCTALFSRPNTTLNQPQPTQPPLPRTTPTASEITITDNAVKQLRTIMEREKDPNQMLRVLVDSGGCHGYQNKFELTASSDEDDIIFEKDGVRVVVDNISLKFIRGSQIDFVEELIGATFQVVANPNAKNSCGCNISYDIDLDMLTQN